MTIYSGFSHKKIVIFNSYVSLPEGKSSIFPWFSHGFPMVFLWFSHFPLGFPAWFLIQPKAKPGDINQKCDPEEKMAELKKIEADVQGVSSWTHWWCFLGGFPNDFVEPDPRCPSVMKNKHGWLENPRTEWRFLSRNIIDKWSGFHCHVWLPEGSWIIGYLG